MQDYEQLKKLGDPPWFMKAHFYRETLQPLLNGLPTSNQHLSFLHHLAWLGWRLGVEKSDLDNVKLIESMCNDLLASYEPDLLGVVSLLVESQHDAQIRDDEAEKYRILLGSDSSQSAATAAIKQYKTIIESNYRLWATIPFLYAIRFRRVSVRASTPQEFVDLPASKKYYAIRKPTIAIPWDGTEGIDLKLRNAGEGHDSWDILDSGIIHFRVIDPSTGKEREAFDLTIEQLQEKIQAVRKTNWILKTGLFIFLENNSHLYSKLTRTRPYKNDEIREFAERIASERAFELESFSLSEDRKNLALKVKYTPTCHFADEAYFGTSAYMKMKEIEKRNKYYLPVFDIIRACIIFLQDTDMPRTVVEMIDEDGDRI